MTYRRNALALAGAVTAIAFFLSSANAADKEIVAGGELVVGIGADVDVLDSTMANYYHTRVVLATMCEKLYEIDENVKIFPQLAAEMPEISADGLTQTIKLRQGMTFQDGTPFNAQAVKTTLDRHLTLATSSRAALKAVVKSVDVVDDHTVSLSLSRPYTPLAAEFADHSGVMMSPAALEKLGDNFSQAPVCVGPFQFASRTPGAEIKLTKAEHYYDRDDVHLDAVTYRVIADPNIRASNLESGDIDFAEGMTSLAARRFQNSGSIVVQARSGLGYSGITFNVNNGGKGLPINKDPNLRKAFEMAIDRGQINQAIFQGMQEMGCVPISPVSPYYRDRECTPYDPEEAKRLIAESGVDTPISVPMLTFNSGDNRRMAEVVQSMVGKVGFKIEISSLDTLAAILAGRSGDFEVFQFGWGGRIDPDGNLNGNVTTKGSNNYAGYSNPEVDRLVVAGSVETDREKRADIYAEVVNLLSEDRAFIYLFNTRVFFAHRANVTGTISLPHGAMRLKEAAFVK